jgi:ParB family transcriptional regulator, chromosome partitioning protein
MARKTGLGRGLDALIPGGGENRTSAGVMQIPVESISPNPRQPRTRFNSEEMDELASSIREHGVIQPLIVTQSDEPGEYILIAGERRLQAARQAELETVPAIVREATDQQRLELALIENVQRADLSPLEAAEAYRQLADDFRLSHEEISTRVGKSRVTVTNTLRLLKLPADVIAALAERHITEGHARALLGLPTPQSQSAALHTVRRKDLTVRETEELVRRLTGEKTPPPARPDAPPEIRAIEERLRANLGTRVRLNRRGKTGTIVIHFYSDEDLDALIGQILGE